MSESKDTKKQEIKHQKPRTKADDIWDMIKGLTLDLFSLPGQTLEKNVTRLDVLPDLVHLKLKSTAVLPAMEEALKTIKLPNGPYGETQSFKVDQQISYVAIGISAATPVAPSLT